MSPFGAGLRAEVAQVLDAFKAGCSNAGQAPAGLRLADMIDHTLLKPQATEEQVRTLCAEAIQHGFAAVCVNPTWVPLSAELLTHVPVNVATVVGFPLGATLSDVKAFEASRAIDAGANEVDMVINIGELKSGHYEKVQQDIEAVVGAAHHALALVKVIIETAYLDDEEKVIACLLAKRAGADFVKTSTGFGPSGATPRDVALMRCAVGPEMGVKAAGGIRTIEDARAMVAAGATRLGTSSGVQIASGQSGAGSEY